jgi:glycosyltransferase involved in cell wall biosynthesis
MKILLINKFHFLKGGSERYLFDLEKLLSEQGHEVVMFSMKSGKNHPSVWEKYFIDEVDLEKISLKNVFKIFYNFDAARKLKQIIRAEKPDIAHLHNIAHQFGPMIINILKKNNIPVVQTLHDSKLVCPAYTASRSGHPCSDCSGSRFYNCARNRCVKKSYAKSLLAMLEAYYEKLILRAYEKVDLFIAPSQYLKNVCLNFGFAKEKIKVIPNFLDIEERLECPNSGGYLLFVGRLSKEKGAQVLLDAMSLLPLEKLIIIGDGPEINNLKNQTEELAIEHRVEFFGYQNQIEVKKYLQKTKALVVPSLAWENLPYVILEAMASGKPVIASDLGGIPELVADGENSYLFKAGDAKDLAEKIKKLNLADQSELSRKALAKMTGFSSKKHYQELVKIYARLANKYRLV